MPPAPAVHSIERGRAVAGALVQWYRAHRRDLPWRRTHDPYAIWVSETMLQQTRVDVVVPYYQRFLERFPSPEVLAAAPLDDVLARWAGLGYYRRARQLHAAAAQVVRDHGGRLPEDEAALRALPGIGRYTAGAIRSIAFERPAPIVDGNVARVLSRLFALKGGPGEADWDKRLWKLAAALVPESDPSSFNQGLMELGAVVCLPRGPRCDECPLARFCRARAAGRAEAYPPPRKRAPIERVERWAILLERADRVLVRRRGPDERNAGFWEFPECAPPMPQPAPSAGSTRADARTITPRAHWARALRAARLPAGALASLEEIGVVRHGILAQRFRVRVFTAALARAARGSKRAPANDWEWIARAELDERPVTSISRKVGAELARARRDGRQLGLGLGVSATPARAGTRGGSTNRRR